MKSITEQFQAYQRLARDHTRAVRWAWVEGAFVGFVLGIGLGWWLA